MQGDSKAVYTKSFEIIFLYDSKMNNNTQFLISNAFEFIIFETIGSETQKCLYWFMKDKKANYNNDDISISWETPGSKLLYADAMHSNGGVLEKTYLPNFI